MRILLLPCFALVLAVGQRKQLAVCAVMRPSRVGMSCAQPACTASMHAVVVWVLQVRNLNVRLATVTNATKLLLLPVATYI